MTRVPRLAGSDSRGRCARRPSTERPAKNGMHFGSVTASLGRADAIVVKARAAISPAPWLRSASVASAVQVWRLQRFINK